MESKTKSFLGGFINTTDINNARRQLTDMIIPGIEKVLLGSQFCEKFTKELTSPKPNTIGGSEWEDFMGIALEGQFQLFADMSLSKAVIMPETIQSLVENGIRGMACYGEIGPGSNNAAALKKYGMELILLATQGNEQELRQCCLNAAAKQYGSILTSYDKNSIALEHANSLPVYCILTTPIKKTVGSKINPSIYERRLEYLLQQGVDTVFADLSGLADYRGVSISIIAIGLQKKIEPALLTKKTISELRICADMALAETAA